MAVSIHWSPAPMVAVGTQTVHFNRPDNTQITTNNASTQTGEEIKKTIASDPCGVTTNSIAAPQVGCKIGMVHIGTQALSWTEIVEKILSKIPHQDPSERIDAKWMYLEDILSLLMKKLAFIHQKNMTIESGNSCDKMAEVEKAANPERKCFLQAKHSKKKKHKHKKDIDKKAVLQLPNNKKKANSRPHPSKVGKRKYKCQFCNQICATSTNLAIHERIHTGEKPYPCSHCDKSFSSKTKVTIHERLHTGDKPFKCSFCDAHFVSSSYMSKHVKAMHTGKPHLCETCGKDFLFKTQLIEHERSHSGLTPFKCQQCKKSFSLKSNLMAHVKRVHVANRPHQCSLCEVKFHGKAEYRLHMQTHNSEPSCLCEQCGKAFHRSDYLARHIRTVHNEKRVKPHVCPFCSKRLARKHVLVLHIRAKHTFEKPYKCPHCVKTWVSKHDLDRHVRTHTGEKPYQCKQCQKQFKSSSNFAKHRKSHTEDSTTTVGAKPTNDNAENESPAGEEQRSKEGSLVSGEVELAQLPNGTSSSTLVPVTVFSSIKHTGLTRPNTENISVPVNENIALLSPVTSRKHAGMEFSQQGIFQAQVNPMAASGAEQSITQPNAVSNTPLLPMGSFISALQTCLVPGNDEEAVNQEQQNQSGNESLISGMPLMQMLQHSTVTVPNVSNPGNHSHSNHNIMSIGNFLSPMLQNRLPGSTVDHDNRLPSSAGNPSGTTAPLIVSMLQQPRTQAQTDPQRHQQLMRNDPSFNLTVPPSGTWQDWYQ